MHSIMITQREKIKEKKTTKHKNHIHQGKARSSKVIQILIQSPIFNYPHYGHLQGDHFRVSNIQSFGPKLWGSLLYNWVRIYHLRLV